MGPPPQLNRVIGLSGGALDLLMPMHVWFGPEGEVVQAGPTFRKMTRCAEPEGRPLFSLVTIRKPRRADTVAALSQLAGQRLSVQLASAPHLPLRGTVAGLPMASGGILNLSLGLSFARAVAQFGLTLNDFSPCDQTVELLYLNEANTATARESRKLTERLQAAREAAEEQALTDTLTGLANRRALDGALRRMLADPMARFGVMHLDLDWFKQVNDTMGHAAGDHVLAHVGDILLQELRASDMAARFGGDEFVLLIRDCEDPGLLTSIAERLIARLEEPILFEGQPCRVSASIGITLSSAYDRPSADRLLHDADLALYASKERGRARHSFYSEEIAGAAKTGATGQVSGARDAARHGAA